MGLTIIILTPKQQHPVVYSDHPHSIHWSGQSGKGDLLPVRAGSEHLSGGQSVVVFIIATCHQENLLSCISRVFCAAMSIPPSVQTGHVPHPAARVVQGDPCPAIIISTSEDNLVTQGNAAGPPCRIFQVETAPRVVSVTGDCL